VTFKLQSSNQQLSGNGGREFFGFPVSRRRAVLDLVVCSRFFFHLARDLLFFVTEFNAPTCQRSHGCARTNGSKITGTRKTIEDPERGSGGANNDMCESHEAEISMVEILEKMTGELSKLR
jgi:hypothetical protein